MNARFDLSHIAQSADALDLLCEGDERLFSDMLVGETDIDHICRRIWEQLARDEEMLAGIAERQASLAERKQRVTARRDGAKALIGRVLKAGHLTKLELPEVTLSIRDGKPTLKVVDPDAVPDELTRIKREPDKTAINETYAQSDALPNWLVREPARDVITARTK
jgi:hypothetical protein